MGLVVGLAFIETPLKFQADGISTEEALGIGRLVFMALNVSEIFLSVVLAFLCFLHRDYFYRAWQWIPVIGVIAIVSVQTVYLLPELRERSDLIIAGNKVGPSYLHAAYTTVEVLKLVLLLLCAWIGFLIVQAKLSRTLDSSEQGN